MKLRSKGVKGWLLATGENGEFVFRVYNSDKSEFTDYKILAQDVEIELIDNYTILDTENKTLNYNLKFPKELMG